MQEQLLARRDLLRATAVIPAAALAASATASEQDQKGAAPSSEAQSAVQTTTLVEVPLSANAKLTVERRGQVALFGLNRPYIQNRVDPETFLALARAYYDYEHDPSLRAAVLFGHGPNFSRGIDVEAYRASPGAGNALAGQPHIVNPLGYGQARITKPLIAVVHGETWNMAHELFLSADIRVAAIDTIFGQDENSHGRFPGGGSTVRFVREAGWGNAMRYMLTGDHWTAQDAYRMGTLQELADSPQAAQDLALTIANKIAACGPLGIRATLASSHLTIDAVEAEAFSKLTGQYASLYHTHDFLEGLAAQAEGRPPVFNGN